MVSQKEADAVSMRIKKLIKKYGTDGVDIARVRDSYEFWRRASGDAMAYQLCEAEVSKLESRGAPT